MKRIIFVSLTLFNLTFIIFGCSHSSHRPEIIIKDIWSRPVMLSEASDTSGQVSSGYNGAVYLKIQNTGGAADRLIGAKAEVCTVTEIHRSFIKDERMMMEPVAEGIEIPAHGSGELKPGSYHLMLMGIKRTLSEGDSFAVQLKFEKSGLKTVYSKIRRF